MSTFVATELATPLADANVMLCNCLEEFAPTKLVAVNPLSIKFANVGAPVVVRFCVIVLVSVEPVKELLQPFALAIVTDCKALLPFVAINVVAVSPVNVSPTNEGDPEVDKS